MRLHFHFYYSIMCGQDYKFQRRASKNDDYFFMDKLRNVLSLIADFDIFKKKVVEAKISQPNPWTTTSLYLSVVSCVAFIFV